MNASVVLERRSARRQWAPLAGIMTLSAMGALGSGLLSAVSSKVIAAVAGPAALGLLGTLQQISQTALTAATANGGTALARGASALEGAERHEFLRTAAVILTLATALVASILWLGPAKIASLGGLAESSAGLVKWIAPIVVLSAAYVFLTSLLNGLGASHKLAVLQLAGPGAMAILAWPAARHAGAPIAFPVMLSVAASATVIAALLALRPYRHRLAAWFVGSGRWWRGRSLGQFLSISGAMLATGLCGAATLTYVRSLIIRSQGLAEAGQFDAAWGISMNQISLVLASLQTHYLPALARARTSREKQEKIASVIMLAAPASAIAIAMIAVAKPFWLRLFYSAEFRHASLYLRWTLLGDYLKVASWILSIPMLAAADMRTFLIADLSACAVFAASAVELARFRSPAEAAAIGFVLMHAVHLVVGAFYVRLRGLPILVWAGGLGLVTGVSFLEWNT